MHEMEKKLTTEKQRLVELSEVNANIKDKDILSIQHRIDVLRKSIKSARLRLDALRFMSSNIIDHNV